jgi:hypothetical protein
MRAGMVGGEITPRSSTLALKVSQKVTVQMFFVTQGSYCLNNIFGKEKVPCSISHAYRQIWAPTVEKTERQPTHLINNQVTDNRQPGTKKTTDNRHMQSTTTLLDGSNVRLNWNIESDMNVHWIKFKNFLSLY